MKYFLVAALIAAMFGLPLIFLPGPCVRTVPFHIDAGSIAQVHGTMCAQREPSLWQRWTR